MQQPLLSDLFQQVRHHTIRILENAVDDSLLFAPAGTSNHIIWHAGHAVWLLDVLCLQLLGQPSRLKHDWAETFGMNCRSVSERSEWPSRQQMLEELQLQQDHVASTIKAADATALERIADPDRGPLTVASRIIHACHDEAKHSGEMYLLQKLFQSQA